MDKAQDETALETIELLESRLQRVQFLLTGRAFADADVLGIAGAEDEDCIPARLERLEKALMDISATSRVAHDALNLCQLLLIAAVRVVLSDSRCSKSRSLSVSARECNPSFPANSECVCHCQCLRNSISNFSFTIDLHTGPPYTFS